jgi:hypothetical protein
MPADTFPKFRFPTRKRPAGFVRAGRRKGGIGPGRSSRRIDLTPDRGQSSLLVCQPREGLGVIAIRKGRSDLAQRFFPHLDGQFKCSAKHRELADPAANLLIQCVAILSLVGEQPVEARLLILRRQPAVHILADVAHVRERLQPAFKGVKPIEPQ